MDSKQLPTKKPDPATELTELLSRLERAKDPAPKDVARFRQLAVELPRILGCFVPSLQSIREQLAARTSDGLSRAFLLAEMDKLKRDLGYDAAPQLERILIDHALNSVVRLVHAERVNTSKVVGQAVSLEVGTYWDRYLSTAHNRFLRAVETLARVRRLARNTPALQINIAHEGGKQVNVQGEVNGKTSPAADGAARATQGQGIAHS